ncbi:MAG: DUF1565 domain-containing protein, partial [Lachnospiraceae bacterium]|nr:DUF1565 domain-containing protein [Lachnospiraceae bacterium]
MSREYHVGKNGCDKWEGSKERPFRTISRAAQMALPGDVITVHQGEYREWVKPANSGRSDVERIVYQAASGEKVVIKGSERVHKWERTGGSV